MTESNLESKANGKPRSLAARRGPAITRRLLLAGAGQAAVLTLLPLGCAPAVSKAWADGTFWDDGSGWSA